MSIVVFGTIQIVRLTVCTVKSNCKYCSSEDLGTPRGAVGGEEGIRTRESSPRRFLYESRPGELRERESTEVRGTKRFRIESHVRPAA